MVGSFSGCVTPPVGPAPPNLQPIKQELRTYVSSGQYARGLAAVAAEATAWIEQRAGRGHPGERLSVVFDLDETLFYNWPQIERNDFGYVPEVWQRWVEAAKAPAISSVLETYRAARARGCAVILITGRPERDRAATERNLRAIGCGEYVALICKPDGARSTAASFKTAARAKFEREGWTIIANVGDQASDLIGGHAERTFKLPNPFYLTD
jgi:acid phosphatase